MALNAVHLEAVPNRRLASLIVPREHGAWGLMLVPLVVGAAVGLLAGGKGFSLIPFAIAALALFWMRTPLENWIGTSPLRAQAGTELRTVGITVLILAAAAALALGSIFRDGRNRALLMLGSIAMCAFVAQALLKKIGRQTRMLAQVTGTLGLTVTAPSAYYLVTGKLGLDAWALWLATFLFAGNQIHFVQLRIHSARISGWSQKLEHGRNFLLGEGLMVGALVLAWHFDILPGLSLIAFLPLFLRGSAWFWRPQKALVVRRLGWSELAHALTFGILLTAGFALGRSIQ